MDIILSPEFLTIGMFSVLFLGVLTGFPLAIPIGGAGLLFGFMMFGDASFDMIYTRVYAQLTNTGFMAVPLFVFMGGMLERSGIAKRMYESLYVSFGRFRGGLAIVSIMIGTIMAACIGVIAASISMLAMVALPVMIKRGYDKGLATGCICAGGTLGILIPPSIMLIVYGPAAWISVGKLFTAAFGPGLMLSGLYMLYIAIRAFFQPSIAPAISKEEEGNYSFLQKVKMLVVSLLPTMVLILSVLGAIYTGIAAPTEAAAVGAVISIVLTVLYRQFSFKALMEVSLSTIKLTCMVLLIASMSTAFVSVFLSGGGGDVVKDFILGFPGGKWSVFAMIMLVTFALGAFIDWVGIIFVLVPILSPIIPILGFDPLWFAMMIIVNLQMSFLTPPFAYAMFFLKGAADPELGIETKDIIRGMLPFVGIVAIGLVLMIIFPQIVLWLPSRM
ncbi:TRAP transporter large permease subunit [Oceanispirochaeta crateris]|uniref:TRAP transporter large permease subunit n=1 Tax=Oceanispirochaeta crateris TaxID=2518645 RepID=A0A5C1QRD0_9SPIO|nr:TRAP transporter large permease subunit [Oceanispirochaeta crateris]QEN09530.1 TRAP transporter large permease subunit [Oceanispirochaeta crateris]